LAFLVHMFNFSTISALLTTVLAYEKLRVEKRKFVGVTFLFFKSNKFCVTANAAIFYMQC